MCGQYDELDPCLDLDDGGEPNGDPFETFGDGE
jgi:hypothetical protein